MEGNTFFTPQEHEQLITLYKRLLQLSKDTLQKDDCRKLKAHLVNAMQGGSIPRNVFGMNPIIKDAQRIWNESHHQGYADGHDCCRRNRHATGLHPGNHAPRR